MPKALESFTITRSAEGYVLQIEDEDGTSFELDVDAEQLDLIAEEIDRQLDEDDDDEVLEVDEDESDEIAPS